MTWIDRAAQRIVNEAVSCKPLIDESGTCVRTWTFDREIVRQIIEEEHGQKTDFFVWSGEGSPLYVSPDDETHLTKEQHDDMLKRMDEGKEEA